LYFIYGDLQIQFGFSMIQFITIAFYEFLSTYVFTLKFIKVLVHSGFVTCLLLFIQLIKQE